MSGLRATPETTKERQRESAKRNTYCGYVNTTALQRLADFQRTVGNRAVMRLLGSGVLQAKRSVSRPDDIHEQEADRVAEEVMLTPEADAGMESPSEADKAVQTNPGRPFAGGPRCGDEDRTGTKSMGIQNLMPSRAKEGAGATEVSPFVAGGIHSPAGSGSGLAAPERSFFEPRFGVSFSGVRVHTGAGATMLARAVNAQAFTVGGDVFFGEGRYRPQTEDGKLLIAHELTHTLQQKAADIFVQRMAACPPRWPDPTPPDWQRYHGDPGVFHCGFRGILENRIPTPEDPQNECFYDHSGGLVDENHPYAGCRGTPNQYDSAESPVSHTLRDTGGIVRAGVPAFLTSRVYDINQAVIGAIRVAQTVGTVVGSLVDAFGQAILLGVLTGRAVVDPTNWRFQAMPARSIRHLNVIGGILSSVSWHRDLNELLTNITRRLDSYSIEGLLREITEDVNQALRSRDPNAPQVRTSDVGALSLFRLIDWLHSQGIIQYLRPPEDIARDELDRLRQ